LVNEVSPGDVNVERLTACQADAATGQYAQALAGFLRWLAPRIGDVRDQLRQTQKDLRDKAKTEGQHARTPGIVADLALGLRYFLDFALEARAVTAANADVLWERGWHALTQAAGDQHAHIAAAEPTGLYLRLLQAAVGSGRAHIAAPDGKEPRDADAWGWRLQMSGAGEHARDEWQCQGKRIGWVDHDDVYLDPDAAFAEAQKLAGEQGEALPISPRTMHKRLHERGLLAVVETYNGRTRFTVRRTLEGRRREVLCLRADSLSAPASAPSAPTGVERRGNGTPSGRTDAGGLRQLTPECAIGAPEQPGMRREYVGNGEELAHLAHPATRGRGDPEREVFNGQPVPQEEGEIA
jgi:hypothetical protein